MTIHGPAMPALENYVERYVLVFCSCSCRQSFRERFVSASREWHEAYAAGERCANCGTPLDVD